MEEQLSPITGLPEKPQISKIDKVKLQSQSFLDNLGNTQSFDTEPFATSKLDYNTYLDALGPDKFKLQFGDEILTKQLQDKQQKDLVDAINKKADEQGFFSEAFNSVQQALVGEVIGGGIAGFGYLADVDTLFGIAEDSKQFGNFISQFGEAIKEDTKNFFPVYQHYGEEGKFAPWEHENFFTNIPSVASMLSILIPVAGEGKLVSMAGTALKTAALAKNAGKIITTADKLLNVVGTLGKTERWFIDGLHKSVVSRRIESLMEAGQTIDQTKDRYLSLGYSEEEANKFANQAGNMNYWLNWGAMLTDLPQYLMMGSNRFMNKSVASRALAKAAGLNPNMATLTAIGQVAVQAIPEGVEEFYQYGTSEEAMHMIDVQNGLDDGSNIGQRINKYAQDGRALTATFFGMWGGGVTHLVTSSDKLNSIWNKNIKGNKEWISETEQRINEINDRHTRLAQNLDHYQKAVEAGNEDAIKIVQKNMAFDMAINAARVGNLNIALSHVQQMQAMSEEDRKSQGLPDNFSENLKTIEQDMRMVADMWNNNDNKYHPATVIPITYREFLLDHWKKEKPLLQQKVDELAKQIPDVDNLSDLGKDLFSIKSQLIAHQRFADTIEKLSKDKNLTKEQLDNFKSMLNITYDNISILQEDFDTKSTNTNDVQFERKLNDQTYVVQTAMVVEKLINDNYKLQYIDSDGNTQVVIKKKSEISGLTDIITDEDQSAIDYLDSKSIDEYHKANAGLLFLNDQIKKITKKLSKLTSKQYQKDVQDIAERRAKMAADKKKKEKQDEERAEDKKKLEPKKKEVKPPTDLDGNQEEEFEEQEEPTPEESSIDEVIEQIEKGEVKEKDLSDDLKEAVTNRRNQLANKGSLDESQEAIDDHSQVGTQLIINEEPETPDNPTRNIEYVRGSDNHKNDHLKQVNALAWKSINNRDQADGLVKPNPNMARALTSYLEDYTKSLDNHSVVFEVDLAMLENNPIPAYEEIRRRLFSKEKLTNFLIRNHQGVDEAWDLMGLIPIKAMLYKDGKQVVHMDQKLTMHLHTSMYRVDTSIQESFDKANFEQRVDILNAYYKGEQLEAKGLTKSNGHLYVEDKAILSPSRTLSDVIGTPESMQLVAGSSELSGVFVDYSGKVVDMGKNKGATPGAIYAGIRTANGRNFPLRLQVSKLSSDEANVVYQLMGAMAKDEELYNKYLSEELVNNLNNSANPIINGLQNYLDLKGMTYGELLDHLVYNGNAKTNTKGSSALYIDFGTKKDGARITSNSIVFGDNTNSVDTFDDPEVKAKFIEHLTKNRRRQVDRKLLNNNEYKRYLNANKILNSNIKTNDGKKLFVQPTITFNSNLSKVETSNKFTSTIRDFADKSMITVKNSNGEVIGSITIFKTSLDHNGKKYAYIAGISTETKFRNQGLAIELYKAAFDNLKDLGFDGLVSEDDFITDKKVFNIREKLNIEKVEDGVYIYTGIKESTKTRVTTEPVVTPEDLKTKVASDGKLTVAQKMMATKIAQKKIDGKDLNVAEQKFYNDHQIFIETLISDKLGNQREDAGIVETPKAEEIKFSNKLSDDSLYDVLSIIGSNKTLREYISEGNGDFQFYENGEFIIADRLNVADGVRTFDVWTKSLINNKISSSVQILKDSLGKITTNQKSWEVLYKYAKLDSSNILNTIESAKQIVEKLSKTSNKKSIFEQNKADVVKKDSQMTEEIFNSLSKREQDRIIECL